MPATRDGSGSLRTRDAQTTDWPSAEMSSAALTMRSSSRSRRIATSFAALTAACWAKSRAAITRSIRSTISAMPSRSIAQPRTRARSTAGDMGGDGDGTPSGEAGRRSIVGGADITSPFAPGRTPPS